MPRKLIDCVAGIALVAVIYHLAWESDTRGEALQQAREQNTTLQGQLEQTEVALNRADALLAKIFGEYDSRRPLLSTLVTVSCYTSRVRETDDTPYQTADMSLVRRGVLAVSRDLMNEVGLEFGQRVLLEGYGIFEVRDVMNRRYRRRVDIWSSDLTAAQKHGVKEKVALMWIGGD